MKIYKCPYCGRIEETAEKTPPKCYCKMPNGIAVMTYVREKTENESLDVDEYLAE